MKPLYHCDMDVALPDLVRLGQTSFDLIAKLGTFYFPKIAVGRPGDGKIQIAQYESGYEAFQIALTQLAQQPIDWLAHTADGYHYSSDDSDPIGQAIQAGMTTCEEQFDAGNPNAYEALNVIKVDVFDRAEGAVCPYLRTPQGIQWKPTITAPSAFLMGRMVDSMRTAIKASHSLVS